MDVMVVIDGSMTMGDEMESVPMSKLLGTIMLAAEVVGELDVTDRVGLVVFHGETADLSPLTFLHQDIIAEILNLPNEPGIPGGTTPIKKGLDKAREHLVPQGRNDAVHKIFLFSDGIDTQGDPVDAADEAKQQGIVILTFSFGSLGEQIPDDLMDMLIPSPTPDGVGHNEAYLHFHEFEHQANSIMQVCLDTVEGICAREVNIFEEVMPPLTATEIVSVEFFGGIQDQPSNDDPELAGNSITMTVHTMYDDDTYDLTFKITSEDCGEFEIDEPESRVEWIRPDGQADMDNFPQEVITVTGCNEPPICDADGPYVAECDGITTTIALDGLGSSDPDNDPLDFMWSSDCPGASFDDPNSPTPMLTVDSSPGCFIVCTVSLTVDDGQATDSCETTVTIEDTTAPLIDCPPDVAVTCGEPTDPGETGVAMAADECDPDPMVDFVDNVMPTDCPADPIQELIERTWTATDACDNSDEGSTCVQSITVLKIALSLDIKPGSCPNPLNRNSHGLLPVSLLGTAEFDVSTVLLDSLRISRADCIGGDVAPWHTRIEDAATPFGGELCDCHELTGDGFDDISMKFKIAHVVDALMLDDLPVGSLVELCVSGTLDDGCEFVACDCVRLNQAQGQTLRSASQADPASR
jgi:hypothetical protein